MSPDTLFSIMNPLALLGWICLVLWPLARKPLMLAGGYAIPLLLSLAYAAAILAYWNSAEGSYDSLENVMLLFTFPGAAVAGWIHYLAFDLFIGGWIVRDAARQGVTHWITIPSLIFTFLFGPVGVLLHGALRLFLYLRPSTPQERTAS